LGGAIVITKNRNPLVMRLCRSENWF